MSNKIEKFISDNRDDFDDKIPSSKVWNEIETALTGDKKKKAILTPLIKWCMAAAAMFIIGTVIYIGFDKKQDKATVVAEPAIPDATDAPEVMAFAKIIVLKQQELKQLSKEHPELYNKFTSDIIQLDSSYQALKKQLSVTPNKEVLVEAMIQNLQLQLSVLNQQLNIIKEIKQSKEYSHEKNSQKI